MKEKIKMFWPKAIVFDMDGVIFDSEQLVISCSEEIASQYHITNIREACIECLGINATVTKKKMLERYGESFPYDEYKAKMSALFHERAANGQLPKKAGIEELLKFLTSHGIKTAVASSTRAEVVIRELRDGGLLQYFDCVVCGDMVQNSKPHPEIFQRAMKELSVEPQETWVIEDSYNGVRAARAANAYTIMVPDMLQPNSEMEEIAQDIVPSLFAVIEKLKTY